MEFKEFSKIKTNSKYITRYIVPFCFSKNGDISEYERIYNYLKTDATTRFRLCEQARNKDSDLYDYLFEIYENSGLKEKNSIGSIWKYINQKNFVYIYESKQNKSTLVSRISDAGMYFMKTGIGLFWYEMRHYKSEFLMRTIESYESSLSKIENDEDISSLLKELEENYFYIAKERKLNDLKQLENALLNEIDTKNIQINVTEEINQLLQKCLTEKDSNKKVEQLEVIKKKLEEEKQRSIKKHSNEQIGYIVKEFDIEFNKITQLMDGIHVENIKKLMNYIYPNVKALEYIESEEKKQYLQKIEKLTEEVRKSAKEIKSTKQYKNLEHFSVEIVKTDIVEHYRRLNILKRYWININKSDNIQISLIDEEKKIIEILKDDNIWIHQNDLDEMKIVLEKSILDYDKEIIDKKNPIYLQIIKSQMKIVENRLLDIEQSNAMDLKTLINFQNKIKELARPHYEVSYKIDGQEIKKECLVGQWINDILTELKCKELQYFPSRKIDERGSTYDLVKVSEAGLQLIDVDTVPKLPDKAILYTYVALIDDHIKDLSTKDVLETSAYYLAMGYDGAYRVEQQVKDNMLHPYANIVEYVKKEGFAECVTFVGDNKNFFIKQKMHNFRNDYFHMYMNLLQQSYSILNMTSELSTGLAANYQVYKEKNRDKENVVYKLEDTDARINLFMIKNINASVSHVENQNIFYKYVESSIHVKEDLEALSSGISALKEILQRREIEERNKIKETEQKNEERMQRAFAVLTIFSALSLPKTMSEFFRINEKLIEVEEITNNGIVKEIITCDMPGIIATFLFYVVTIVVVWAIWFSSRDTVKEWIGNLCEETGICNKIKSVFGRWNKRE